MEKFTRKSELVVKETVSGNERSVALWQRITAVSFGTLFIVVLLGIALLVPNPTAFQILVFRVTLSLAAGGVGAIVPGFIDVQFKNWLRAGGALALFVLVYQLNPPALITEPNVPPEPQKIETKTFNYPQIKRTTLRFGLTLGWQLARFEFIDGSDIPEAKTVRPEVYGEIKQLLTQDGFPQDFMDLNAQELIRTVISYYGSTDIYKHSSILLGIAALRASLIGASVNKSANQEMERLALSAIREIDGSVVPRKIVLFNSLLKVQPRNVPDLIVLIDTHWQLYAFDN